MISDGIECMPRSAFTGRSSLISVTINDTVTIIYDSAFAFCIQLETVILGKGVNFIYSQVFYYYQNMKCIYFYADSPPIYWIWCFSDIPVNIVMTLETYQGEIFGELNVSKGSTIDECLPPTHTFAESDTFTESNAFTVQYTFTKSDALKESITFSSKISGYVTFSNTHSWTYSLSQTLIMTIVNSTISNTFSIPKDSYY